MNEHGKYILDGLSISAVAATLAGMLPAIAAFFTIVWTGIRIYETRTVQRLLGKPKMTRREDRD